MFGTGQSRATTLLVALLLALGTLTGTAQAAATLTATFSVVDQGSWKQGKYVVANSGDTASDTWRIEFDLPSGTTVGTVWYGTRTVDGDHVTIDAAHYNAAVPPGGDTEPYSPWFELLGPGQPVNCRINGDRCDGSPDQPPGPPDDLRSTGATTRTVSLAWNAAAPGDFPVSGYVVAGGGSATVTGTTALVSGLSPNTEYTFTVRARDGRGNTSQPSNAVTVRTNDPADDTQPPSTPANLRTTGVTSSSVSLAWNASSDSSGIAGYEVYSGAEPAAFVSGTSATVTGLSPSTSYTFTVKARDDYDNVSPASNAVEATTDDVVGDGNYARVGYFVQWGIYGRQYFVRDLDTSGAAAKLTHVNYAFGNIDPENLTCLNGVTKGTSDDPQDPDQGTGAGDAVADYTRPMSASQSVDGVADTGWEPLRGNFNQLRKLKAKHPHLKVLISLGGWTYSKFFSDVAATDASRQKFVKSCIDMYIKGNLPPYNGAGGPGVAAGIFDGIDLDWEWPGAEGHAGNHVSPADKRNNTLLCAEFRRQLDALTEQTGKRYLLTAFTPADPAKIAAGWEISGGDHVFEYLDFANVQGYDFHGSGSDNSWEPNRTGHQANWYTDADDPYDVLFSAESALDVYTDAGVNPRKLTIGIPFYGRGWQGVTDGGRHGEWQAANGAAPGQFPAEAGTRGYDNLMTTFPNLTVYHDEQALATYGYTGPNGQWWSFDDAWSIGRKMAIVKQRNLLGAMIWEMSGDDGTLMTALDDGLR
ncbi:MAG TPA: glycosyl hydrolase family 18 protein [Actinophytocola sp.]|nr:glycosyl hydrolase family 18 protein [Actinophytocola sp.]